MFKGTSELQAHGASLVDHARTLYQKLTKSAAILPVAAGVAGGLGILYGERDRLLGYHKIYHGTSRRAADAIALTGLDPNWGGKGGAAENAQRGDYVDNSQNKVHFTKLRRVAQGYADTVGTEGGKVLTAYIPHSLWDEAQVDPDASWGLNRNKRVAATTHDAITVQNLKHQAMDYANMENLEAYLDTESGRERALSGLATAIAGGTALGLAAKKLAKVIR